MQAATQVEDLEIDRAVGPAELTRVNTPWILLLPLVFYAAQGQFSFQVLGNVTGGFEPGTVAVRDTSILNSVIIPGLVYAIVLWLMRNWWPEVLSLATRFKALSLMAAFALVSTIWSQDPLHSALAGACYCVDTLFAFYLVSSLETEKLMTVLERLLLIVCLSSLFMIAFFPKLGVSQLSVRNPNAWAGIFIFRTAATKPLLYLVTASFMLWRKHFTIGRSITLLFALLFIYKAHVVTTDVLLALYVGYLIVQFFNMRLAPRSSFALLASVIGGGLIVSAVGISLLPTILHALGRDPTLTGRTEIWSILINSVMKRPFLGYGYYAFWEGLKGESGIAIHRLQWTVSFAHNGYLEVALQLGILGLAAFLVTLVQAIRNAWICLRFDRTGGTDWHVGIILLAIFYNLDDCTVLWPKDLVSVLYIVACCCLSITARRLQRVRYVGEAA